MIAEHPRRSLVGRSLTVRGVRVLWRGAGGGYGRLGFLRWRLQRWAWNGRWHLGYGPVVLSRPERLP